MPQPDDQEIDLLLSRGRLTEHQRDAVFGNVLHGLAAQKRTNARRPWWLWGGIATGVLGLGGLTLFLGHVRPPDPQFRSKGAPSGLVSTVECEAAHLSACPVGARLLFRPARASGLLAAFAQPINGGEPVWYFDPAHPVALDANVHASGYLRQTVLIGSEHRVGKYRLHLLMLATPATKAAVLEGGSTLQEEQVIDLVIK